MHAVDQKSINDAAWKACDTFRGVVDPAQYKDYILIFLFWKYVSDLWRDHYAKYAREYGGDDARVRRRMARERFVLPEGSSFYDVYAQRSADNPGELINVALQALEDANRAKLGGVLTNVDFNSTNNLGETADRNRRLKNLFADFAKPELDFSPSRFDGETNAEDAIGETYIYLISQFAADAGKKAGEFFTPRRVSELLVRLADPGPGSRIYDPACGSSTLLIRAAEEVARKQSVETPKADVKLFGQEATRQTQGLARMNMFLHGLDDARIEWGDTLNNPKLIDGDALMRFNIVLANPPFSLDKWGAENARNDRWRRFHRGVPPKSRGDFAFISHMIESAKPREGRVAVIAPHGVLFRGGAEGRVREKLIEENLLDGVIGLPPQLFPSTDIPVVMLLFDRAREKGGAREKAEDIVFIDASRDFIIGRKQNQLGPDQLDRIVAAWRSRQNIDRYSAVVSRQQVREHDYNLNIPRYVDVFEPQSDVDIDAIQKEIEELEKRLASTRAKIGPRLAELGLPNNLNLPAAEFELSELLTIRDDTSDGTERVHSVSVHKGLVDQIEHLGRSFAAASTSHYRVVEPGDVVYTKSPTGDFPLGVVKQSRISENAIVSPLYAVYKPKSFAIGVILDAYFKSPDRAARYSTPLVHKGAKNTINVTDSQFLKGRISIPAREGDQEKLADVLLSLLDVGALNNALTAAHERKNDALISLLFAGGDAEAQQPLAAE